jgi:hypothetical protein
MSPLPGVVPSGTFSTKEGRFVVIGGNGDSVYSRLMTVGSLDPKIWFRIVEARMSMKRSLCLLGGD